MNTKRAIAIFLLSCVLSLPIIGCSCSQIGELPIDRDTAVMIAKANIPSRVVDRVQINTLFFRDEWMVFVLYMGENKVTKSELGWPESPNNQFYNYEHLPMDTYSLLEFTIDRHTGAVLLRKASDLTQHGFPGSFNNEPPEPVFLPLWSIIVSGIGGLIIGGMIVWLLLHRRKTTIVNETPAGDR